MSDKELADWRGGKEAPNATIIMRLFDIVASSLGLVFMAPICIIIMIFIFIESKGPVFFLQKRLGFRQSEFTLYKFRSMNLNAEKNGAQWAERNDPRVTKIGRIIRRLHLDELPQLWNIIKGDMSLVGPRPIRKMAADKLSKLDSRYNYRFFARPGLTGMAQLYAPYGFSEKDQLKKIEYDLCYFSGFTFGKYISVIVTTMWRLVSSGKASYE